MENRQKKQKRKKVKKVLGIPISGTRIKNERQRIKDIFRNKSFLKKVAHARKHLKINKNGTPVTTSQLRKEALEIAKKYQISFERGSPLYDAIVYGKLFDDSYKFVDRCIVLHRFAGVMRTLIMPERSFSLVGITDDVNDKHYSAQDAYPIQIGLTADTTEIQLKNFIHQNWPLIKHIQRLEKPKADNPRTRRTLERDEFIWKNRKVKAQELYELVNEKFHHQKLSSVQAVYDILYKLRNRHKKSGIKLTK